MRPSPSFVASATLATATAATTTNRVPSRAYLLAAATQHRLPQLLRRAYGSVIASCSSSSQVQPRTRAAQKAVPAQRASLSTAAVVHQQVSSPTEEIVVSDGRHVKSNEPRVSLATGDLVEVRKAGKVHVGVLVWVDPMLGTLAPTSHTTILSNGHIVQHSRSDVFFAIPGWSYLPYVQQIPKGASKEGSFTISAETARHLSDAGIPRFIISHIAEFQNAVVTNSKKLGESLSSLPTKLVDNKMATFSIDDAANLVVADGPASPAELYTVYLHLCKSGFAVSPVNTSQLLETRLFRCRSQEEQARTAWVAEQLRSTTPIAGETLTVFQKFIEKCKRLIVWSRMNGPLGFPSSAADASETVQPDSSFTADEMIFINMALESIGVAPNFASFEKIVAQVHILKRLSPLYSFYPTESDVLMFLKEIGIHTPWENTGMMRPMAKGKVEFISGPVAANMVAKSLQLGEALLARGEIGYDDTGKCIIKPAAENPEATLATSEQQRLLHQQYETVEDPASWSVIDRFKSELHAIPTVAGGVTSTDTFYETDTVADSRVDFGEQRVFVIDSTTAHELDDGVSIEETADGTWVHIHIADPTAYLPPNHSLAYISQLRSTSVYLPERHYPMMPDYLSDYRFNLDISPCVLTFSARLADNGEIIDYRVQPGIIRRPVLVSYEDADLALDWSSIHGYTAPRHEQPIWARSIFDIHDAEMANIAAAPVETMSSSDKRVYRKVSSTDAVLLRKIQQIAQKHLEFRIRNGGFVQDRGSAHVGVNPYPLPPTVVRMSSSKPAPLVAPTVVLSPHETSHFSPAHMLVAEMMIIAGRVAAKFCIDHKLPVPYRSQPSTEEYLTERHSALGSDDKLDLQRNLYNSIIDQRDRKTGIIPFELSQQLSSLIPAGKWGLEPLGHASMGLAGASTSRPPKPFDSQMIGYVKATSPLRRFKDMLVHWQIKSVFAAKSQKSTITPPFSADQILNLAQVLHKIQKRTQDIASQSDRYWMFEFIRRREILAAQSGQTTDPITNKLNRDWSIQTIPTHAFVQQWDSARALSAAADRAVVYHAVVTDDRDAPRAGRTARVQLVELGFMQVQCRMEQGDPSISARQPSGERLIQCVVDKVDPTVGRISFSQIQQ